MVNGRMEFSRYLGNAIPCLSYTDVKEVRRCAQLGQHDINRVLLDKIDIRVQEELVVTHTLLIVWSPL